MLSSAGCASDIRNKGGGDGVDGAPGQAEPALTPSSSCPFGGASQEQGTVGSCWVLAGSEGPSLDGPKAGWHHLMLVTVGQELGWPHAEAIAQYWTTPLGHLGFVTGVKWAIRSARSHPWLCNGSSVSLSFQSSVCPSVE